MTTPVAHFRRSACLVMATVLPLWLGCGARKTCTPKYRPTTTDAHGFLWLATAPGKTIVLLGTHGAAGSYDVPSLAWPMLRAANMFIAEVDEVDGDDRYTAEKTWADTFRLPRGQSLRKLLSSDDYFDLENILRYTPALRAPHGITHHGSHVTPMSMKPWGVMLVLARNVYRFPSPNITEALFAEAKRNKKPMRFLDTWDEQVRFLDESGTAAKLSQAIRDYGNIGCNIRDAVSAFRVGDDAALAAFVALDDDPIVARVQRWMPKLDSYVQTHQRVFVAVGLSNLRGPNGVLAQLEARGYHVRRQ